MRIVLWDKTFFGEEGKEKLFQLCDLLDSIDNKSVIEFNNCHFVQMSIDINQLKEGTLKRVVALWIFEQQSKGIPVA